jgi:hypothetical protein
LNAFDVNQLTGHLLSKDQEAPFYSTISEVIPCGNILIEFPTSLPGVSSAMHVRIDFGLKEGNDRFTISGLSDKDRRR